MSQINDESNKEQPCNISPLAAKIIQRGMTAANPNLPNAAKHPCQAAVQFPTTKEDVEIVEDVLAKEMDSLSLVERDQILFDIHGFAEPEEENEEMLDRLLEQMEEEICKSTSNKEAYVEAKYLDSNYVTNRAFRLMFIRCERYDPKKAAEKIIIHFTMKRDLFGSGELLAREIRLSDLSESDMETLESGFLQVLPTRDAAGRSIFCVTPSHKIFKSPENMARTLWYVFTTTLRDEETQRKGCVILVYNNGHQPKVNELMMMKRIHTTRLGIPKKVCGAHYCYTDSSLRPFVAGIRLFMERDMRNRMKPHFGTHDELQFTLQTYGINAKDHPMNANGELSLAYHKEWLQIRKTQEEANRAATDDITIPRRFDVLFGRGKNTREHTGNLRAAHLVDMYQEKYEQANKFQKTEIAERIVSIIHESYGRFLKWEKDCWVEVEHDAAREKISHFFRHNRSKNKQIANTTGGEQQQQPSEIVSATATTTAFKRVTPCPSPVHTGGAALEIDEKAAKHLRATEAV